MNDAGSALDVSWPEVVDPVEAVRTLNAVYPRVRDRLADWLGWVHGLDRSSRFWETLLYRFLTLHVLEVFLRYCLLAEALEKGGAPIVLPPAAYRVPANKHKV